LLAGDAGGFADPVTAEGISFALLTGALAAEAVLAAGGDEERARREYHARLRTRVLTELRCARLVAHVLYAMPRARRALLRRYGQFLAEGLADVFVGSSTYREMLSRPGNYLKLVRRQL
jgi:flavin-dependent dehydrogenase